MNQLTVNQLSFTVPGEQGAIHLLEEVSLGLCAGECIGILGPNGAGKSTLVKLLAGLLPAARGSVALNNQPIGEMSPAQRAMSIAYLAQRIELAWSLTVRDVVQLGRLAHRSADNDSIVDRIAARTNIAHLLSRSALSLSGGELMRVHVARLLATDADVILADEPIAGLDPYYQLEVMSLLADEARNEKIVVVVLHDLSMALRYCDRVVVLHEGQVAANGAPAEVLDERLLEQVYRIEAQQIDAADGKVIVPIQRKT